METLFGKDYKKTINSFIQLEIDKHPDNYLEDTVINIGPEQSFYIENGQAVVQFSPYEIAAYAAGTPGFRIAIPGETPLDVGLASPRLGRNRQSLRRRPSEHIQA